LSNAVVCGKLSKIDACTWSPVTVTQEENTQTYNKAIKQETF
jgi:hypothetical protein